MLLEIKIPEALLTVMAPMSALLKVKPLIKDISLPSTKENLESIMFEVLSGDMVTTLSTIKVLFVTSPMYKIEPSEILLFILPSSSK